MSTGIYVMYLNDTAMFCMTKWYYVLLYCSKQPVTKIAHDILLQSDKIIHKHKLQINAQVPRTPL